MCYNKASRLLDINSLGDLVVHLITADDPSAPVSECPDLSPAGISFVTLCRDGLREV